MTKNKERIAILGMAFLLTVSAGQFDYAHSGRTDSSGGHKDNKNASGLGSYHYHHGYGPHLHTGGVCPYEVSTSNSNTTVIIGTVKEETVIEHVHGHVPSFKISVCGSETDQTGSLYPLFVYKNITYLPMTWDMCHALGITSEYNNSTGLHLTTGQAKGTSFEPMTVENVDAANDMDVEIDDVDVIVWIDGEMITEDSQFPFKMHNGVTYVPLTWDMAEKLGIQYSFSAEAGLIIE